MIIRSYTELRRLETMDERYDYLALGGQVGEATFGWERYLNQAFYRSKEWSLARRDTIARDLGNDLGVPDNQIFGQVFVHHMNPLTKFDIENGTDNLLDPEYLVVCSFHTHNAIHFGDKSHMKTPWVERRPGDTKLWGNR